MLASHIPHLHLLSSNFSLSVTRIVRRFLISFHFFPFSPIVTLTVFQSLLSSTVCQGSKELKSYCCSVWDQILPERLTVFHIHHHFRVGDIAIDENKVYLGKISTSQYRRISLTQGLLGQRRHWWLRSVSGWWPPSSTIMQQHFSVVHRVSSLRVQ